MRKRKNEDEKLEDMTHQIKMKESDEKREREKGERNI
jgi:hypothetical protein